MNDTIFSRKNKNRNFTVIDNTMLQDETISWKAKGLFAYILSLPDDWKIYLNELETHAADGRDSLHNGINELIEHGYLTRERIRDEKGRMCGVRYWIDECPKKCSPITGNPISVEPQLLNTNNTKYKADSEESSSALCAEQELSLSESESDETDDIPKPEKKPRVPRNDVEKVEETYFKTWKSLHERGILSTEEPLYEFGKNRALIKRQLTAVGIDSVCHAIEAAANDEFCTSRGFSLSLILSTNVLNGFINGNRTVSKKTAAVKKIDYERSIPGFDFGDELPF